MNTRTRTITLAKVLVTKVRYINYGGGIHQAFYPPPPSSAYPSMSSPASLLPLLPLAIKNKHVINTERYLSGAL
jgi:hypothetical protein